MPPQWDESLLLGFEEIDQQHRSILFAISFDFHHSSLLQPTLQLFH